MSRSLFANIFSAAKLLNKYESRYAVQQFTRRNRAIAALSQRPKLSNASIISSFTMCSNHSAAPISLNRRPTTIFSPQQARNFHSAVPNYYAKLVRTSSKERMGEGLASPQTPTTMSEETQEPAVAATVGQATPIIKADKHTFNREYYLRKKERAREQKRVQQLLTRKEGKGEREELEQEAEDGGVDDEMMPAATGKKARSRSNRNDSNVDPDEEEDMMEQMFSDKDDMDYSEARFSLEQLEHDRVITVDFEKGTYSKPGEAEKSLRELSAQRLDEESDEINEEDDVSMLNNEMLPSAVRIGGRKDKKHKKNDNDDDSDEMELADLEEDEKVIRKHVAMPQMGTGKEPDKLMWYLHEYLALNKGKPMMTVQRVLEIIRDHKGIDVCVMDLKDKCYFAAHMIFVTGQTARHMRVIAERVVEELKQLEIIGLNPVIEGADCDDWMVVDGGTFVLHVFSASGRAFYDIERKWAFTVKEEFEALPLPEHLRALGMESTEEFDAMMMLGSNNPDSNNINHKVILARERKEARRMTRLSKKQRKRMAKMKTPKQKAEAAAQADETEDWEH
eukprot:GEZU01013314.1.p1 GENE.GEZU01013314.1~~GEZU01013314.1.p1  ORF type:complete len:564 (-),score=139.01 GEZU01013314.1:85-1776(-)